MKRLLFTLLASGLVVSGCKKDSNDSPSTAPPVALKGTYKPYEVAEIRYRNTLDGMQPLEAEVAGKMLRLQ